MLQWSRIAFRQRPACDLGGGVFVPQLLLCFFRLFYTLPMIKRPKRMFYGHRQDWSRPKSDVGMRCFLNWKWKHTYFAEINSWLLKRTRVGWKQFFVRADIEMWMVFKWTGAMLSTGFSFLLIVWFYCRLFISVEMEFHNFSISFHPNQDTDFNKVL